MRRITIMSILAMLALPRAHADGIGRLFFTPQQRAQFEREHALAEENNPAYVLRLDGIVQNSNGARTLWINGKMQNADNSSERETDEQSITVPGRAQPLRIKVGQHLLLEQAGTE